jgi:hypothetical protein
MDSIDEERQVYFQKKISGRDMFKYYPAYNHTGRKHEVPAAHSDTVGDTTGETSTVPS